MPKTSLKLFLNSFVRKCICFCNFHVNHVIPYIIKLDQQKIKWIKCCKKRSKVIQVVFYLDRCSDNSSSSMFPIGGDEYSWGGIQVPTIPPNFLIWKIRRSVYMGDIVSEFIIYIRPMKKVVGVLFKIRNIKSRDNRKTIFSKLTVLQWYQKWFYKSN